MSFYSWPSSSGNELLWEEFAANFRRLELSIFNESLSHKQIYFDEVFDPRPLQDSKVNIWALLISASTSNYQIEVRSLEPIFRVNTSFKRVISLLNITVPLIYWILY